ncbi:molybdenum ABC transporter substrate-binding protein [Advenella kashmirensis W13003]|uniref:Molybdenum ABC transporter substrate-binding protein n=1 Tax=Advenella kashmirensis W13003 TaxID=1424334 RepID=V8QMQ8_9BURK|nr:molybdate ABC transporter substrate-binding protein [Advenella kashmirensis]ETF01261.1 molybdenum ABC transporter substrate-binding protein [Advenella kashmirensis W13003]
MNEAIVVYAAGSLKRALTVLFERFEQDSGLSVHAQFGPAGLLRERLQKGERADLFASADRANPARLVAMGLAVNSQRFARNELCAVVKNNSDICTETLLTAMLDPLLTVGTSTPVLDPSGDYAVQVFEKADQLRNGASAILKSKATPLVGGRTSTPIPDGWAASEYLVDSGTADIFLSYASYRDAIELAGRTRVIELPGPLQIQADYVMASMNPESGHVLALRAFIMSEAGQAILKQFGFRDHAGC